MSPLWHQLLEFYEIHFTSISSWTWLSNSTDHWLQLACRGNNQIFLLMSHNSILDKISSKSDLKNIYFMFELRLRKGKKMRRRQGSGFENLLDHLFSFYSLLQVLKRKWEEDEEAALMNAKCLFPSNSLWWWILCPKDRYKFPYVLRKNESYNSKLYTSMKFGLVFSGHILSLQQTYYCVVCERLKRKNGKATSTVWRQPYSIKHVDPTFPIQYIEFWISRQPAHSTIEQRGKVIYFHCQSIVPFPTFEVK